MLKNAHIRSMSAALMRSPAVVSKAQDGPRILNVKNRATALEIRTYGSENRSQSPLMLGRSTNGQGSE